MEWKSCCCCAGLSGWASTVVNTSCCCWGCLCKKKGKNINWGTTWSGTTWFFFIQRHINFIYHFLPKFNFKKLKKYYKSSQFFVLKLYHSYSLRHMFYLLGKLSLRATQSLWNGNNWRTSIMGSENNKRIYISYTYTMLKYGTSKAFSQSITLKRVKQVKN